MGMTEVSFVIPGRIAGKGRPRFNHKTRTTYTPPKTRNAESMVRQCAATAMGGRAPLEGLLSLDIAVVLIPPLSWSKKRRAEAIYVTGRPDADNIIKLIGDSLNGVVWIDDAQIARILFCRRFDGGPECARISVERLISGLQTRGVRGMTYSFADLPPLSYDVILADPPWRFDLRSAAGEEKSPQAQYDCLSVDDIAALRVGQLARGDCLCVMWTTWPMLCRADPAPQRVMRAWGFVPVTGGAWFKRTAADRQSLGTGYVMRSTCEPFVLGRMGSPLIKAQPGNLETFDDGTAIIAPVRGHSRKPDTMYDLIERLLPRATRGLELFARQRWKGAGAIQWDCWGNETEKFEVAA